MFANVATKARAKKTRNNAIPPAMNAEMTKMVLDSEQYKKIASKEHIYAIEQGVSRFNVADPSSVFHYEVYVKTDQQSYIFMCKDKACSDVKNEGWTYSRYSDQKPILPLNKNK